MLALVLALGAGVATAMSPCILPMLPLLLGASASREGADGRVLRHRPLFIVLGFVVAFASAAIAFGASTRVLGVSQQALRHGGIAVMLLSGALLMWPRMLERVMAPLGGLADAGYRWGARAGAGHVGGLLLGMSLGLLWTPCAGPVLASVLALIATEQDVQQASSLLLAYAAGAGLPMLAIAYGGQAMTNRARRWAGHAGQIRGVLGALVVATATTMIWGGDVAAAAWVSRQVSGVLASQALAAPQASATPAQAPEFAGIERWFNGPPQTMAQLRGKVVLIDFWTHACVNCINTLPHLQQWHERYGAQGLVVVGVHTPEFAFEREAAAVQGAITRWGLTYPVAQDNRYQTWTAWRNAYWPALYLVDRQGRVVFQHVGEGDYAHIEARIRHALQPPAATPAPAPGINPGP